MDALRNFSFCGALVSLAAFSMTGCCSGGSCPLFSGHRSAQATSQDVSNGPCETCGNGASYSTPAQSYVMPNQSSSTTPQDYSTQGFPTSEQTAVESSAANLPGVQSAVEESTEAGFIPTTGGSGSR